MTDQTPAEILQRGIPKDILSDIMKSGNYQTVPEGRVLFRKGDAPDCMYALVYGEIDIIDPVKNGPDILLATLSSGAVTGEMGLFTKTPRSATAITKTSCVLLKLDEESIKEWFGKDPDVMIQFFLNIIEILSRLIRKLIEGKESEHQNSSE